MIETRHQVYCKTPANWVADARDIESHEGSYREHETSIMMQMGHVDVDTAIEGLRQRVRAKSLS
jgi:hypothetical protein